MIAKIKNFLNSTRSRKTTLLITLAVLVSPANGVAQEIETPTTESVNILWVCLCAALVFIMQAGFALLESGMVRVKNTINVLMKNYTDMCFGALAFWMIGYGLMFGSNFTGWFGTDKFFANGLSLGEYSNLFFQMMFAATAATIISGALAERIFFRAYTFCVIFTTGFIYALFGNWAWNDNGWLNNLGFIDFAGSTVVHSVGAWSALAGIILLGPRLGKYSKDGKTRLIPGHNLTLVGLSGFLLWFGWFGFNGGSTSFSDPNLGKIFLNTQLSAAAGVVAAVIVMTATRKPVLMTTTVTAGIGGLVSITAGAATMDPLYAVITGSVAGILVVFGIQFMDYMKLDDVVGAIPAHGFCGVWGTLAAGLFYSENMFSLSQTIVQLTGIVTAFVWAFSTSFVAFLFISSIVGLRVSSIHEQRGLDFTEHYEIGYPEFQQSTLHEGKE